MRLWICGVRGSTPAPGEDFVRYGGQTSCIAVSHDGDRIPRLILDGGTGLRRLTSMMQGLPFNGTVLIGHLHWDHTHGLPFFRAGDRPDARVSVRIPEQGDASEVMARVCSPPHFPVRLEELKGDWTVGSIDEGTEEVEGFTVTSVEIPHKKSRTFGYRVSDGRSSIAYLSDHAPQNLGPGPDGFGPYHDAARTLADSVDLLIHDSQYTRDEFPLRADYGHSSIDYAIGLGKESGARSVMLFHHDPERTDDQIDAILASSRNGATPMVEAAVEGAVIDLPR